MLRASSLSNRVGVDAAIRVVDIVAALVALVLLSPLFCVVAVAIRCSSPGPVFFRQSRVGRHFRRFRIMKFRTMVDGAADTGGGPTVGDHDCTTRVGSVLRKYKIDELPQLVNVLRGEMSLVGPRPESPRYVEMFRRDYERLLSIRPGITDPASIAFRNESQLLTGYDDPEDAYVKTILPEKIRLAGQYVEQRCLGLYFRLIGRTIKAVFFTPDAAGTTKLPAGSGTD